MAEHTITTSVSSQLIGGVLYNGIQHYSSGVKNTKYGQIEESDWAMLEHNTSLPDCCAT